MSRLPELILILAIFVLLFGAQKLPEVGAALGRAIREFKKNLRETQEVISASTSEDLKKSRDSLPAESQQQEIKKPVESESTPK